MDLAFFSKPDFQGPEKEVGRHAGEDGVMPGRILPDLVVIHPEFRFDFLDHPIYSKPWFGAESSVPWNPALASSFLVLLGEPSTRNEEALVHERISVARGVSCEEPCMAMNVFPRVPK